MSFLNSMKKWFDSEVRETRRVTPRTCQQMLRSLLRQGYTERRGYTACEKYDDGSVYIAVWIDPPEGKS